MDLQSFDERRESSTKSLRDYVTEQNALWVVPQEVLEQGYLLSQNIPEGHALVLKAEPETEEA